MRRRTWLITVLLGCAPLMARAAEPVDLALVLVADVSESIDETEFALQKAGYAEAFSNPDVVASITGGGMLGTAAVAYVEFAGKGEASTVVGWTVIRDAASAAAFGQMVALAPRSFQGDTSISTGIDHARRLLEESGIDAARRVIDVSADGRDKSDGSMRRARDAAVALGITINALAIIDDRPLGTIDGRLSYTTWEPAGPLSEYLERQVIGGPASFVTEARDFAVFGEALTRKLIIEIAATAQ